MKKIPSINFIRDISYLTYFRQANDVGTQFQESGLEPERPAVKCYGLARRTRTETIQAPYLFNVKTGQASPVPSFLFSAENWVISKMEK